ncbi:unnamed protein product, partial [Laminaria digitata]
KALRKTTDGRELAIFWRTYGTQNFRVMSEVARGVLGAQASAAVLERDFGEQQHQQPQQQQRCDASAAGPLAYVEMVMFLRGAYDSIPVDVPELGDEELEDAIPVRMRGGS